MSNLTIAITRSLSRPVIVGVDLLKTPDRVNIDEFRERGVHQSTQSVESMLKTVLEDLCVRIEGNNTKQSLRIDDNAKSIAEIHDLVVDLKIQITQLMNNSVRLSEIKQSSSVIEYYEEFVSIIIGMKLTDDYVLNCFIDGLEEEIKWMVKMYEPQNLHSAFCLAKLHELTIRTQKPKSQSKLEEIEVLYEKEVEVVEQVVAHKVFDEMPQRNLSENDFQTSPDLNRFNQENRSSNKEVVVVKQAENSEAIKGDIWLPYIRTSEIACKVVEDVKQVESNDDIVEFELKVVKKQGKVVEVTLSQDKKTMQTSSDWDVVENSIWKLGLQFQSDEKREKIQYGVNKYSVFDKLRKVWLMEIRGLHPTYNIRSLEDYLGRRFRSSRRLNWNRLSVVGGMDSFEDGESITYSELTSAKEPKDGVAEVVNEVALKSVKAVKVLVFHLLENLLENLNVNLFKIYDWKSVQLVVTFFSSIIEDIVAHKVFDEMHKRKFDGFNIKRRCGVILDDVIGIKEVGKSEHIEELKLKVETEGKVAEVYVIKDKETWHESVVLVVVQGLCMLSGLHGDTYMLDLLRERDCNALMGPAPTKIPYVAYRFSKFVVAKESFLILLILYHTRKMGSDFTSVFMKCQVSMDFINNSYFCHTSFDNLKDDMTSWLLLVRVAELDINWADFFKSQSKLNTFKAHGIPFAVSYFQALQIKNMSKIFATCYLEKWMVKNKKQVVKWWLIKWKWKKLSNRSTDIWKNGIRILILGVMDHFKGRVLMCT